MIHHDKRIVHYESMRDELAALPFIESLVWPIEIRNPSTKPKTSFHEYFSHDPSAEAIVWEYCAEDFDAYRPEKWNSNMFTLERRRVKSKLENLGEMLEQELESATLSLIMNLSDEFPSLWNNQLTCDNGPLFVGHNF